MIIQAMHTPLPHSPVDSQLSGIAKLENLGVIRVTGEDAVKFLQGQLTQDVALMRPDEAHLAAFCNAKGRMQASFVVFRRDEDTILMVCSKDILAQTLKRLSMFVMRAKARLTDASDDFKLFGVAGNAIESIASTARQHWAKADFNDQDIVFLYPGAGVQRALLCVPASMPAPTLPDLPEGAWNWLEVQSGIAMITQPIFEAFVPQMLNYESIGGVNFKKGCYPGQEVVARSQFRGTLKRRAYLAHSDAPATVGQEVFHASDAEQPCGLVAASAASPQGGFDIVVSMQTSAAADAGGGKLTLGSSDGAALNLLSLPYELLDDI
jgi:folate-binding protein YgfZ